MKISKEGISIIFTLLMVLAALAAVFIFLTLWALTTWAEGWWVGGWWRVAGWVVAFWGLAALVTWGFIIAFFRIPARPCITDDDIVFSPCDGTVVVIEDVMEREVTGERRRQVSIFMSVTNVHINWFPVSGLVSYFKHHNGRFHVAWHPKSSEENEHTTTAVDTAKGERIVFKQVAGMVARRIVSYARTGEQAVQNTPCGFIKFGSRVDLFLPPDAEVLVEMGQKVRGSQTRIARFAKAQQ